MTHPVITLTHPRVRHLHDDGIHVGTVEPGPAGFRAVTPRGLQLGTFASEPEAVTAIQAHRRARRAVH